DIETYQTVVTVANGLNTKLDHKPVDVSGYNTFATTYGLSADMLEDEPGDGDGICNLIEYAVAGMNPTSNDGEMLPMFLHDLSDDKMRLTLNRRPDATDVQIEVMISTDLSVWLEAGSHPTVSVETDDASQLIISFDAGTRVFFFFRVTHLP
ncbi:MAG: hypothetical protein AAF591_05150, partial [Verrucomicrobiota bacterium]